jgi:hypothetical protein
MTSIHSGASAQAMQARLAAELSLPARVGHIALLLAALGSAGISAALLLTETGLPARTRVAFALMVVIGCCWVAFATWVLARRRVLFARHRVIAARMAVTFSAMFTIGSVALRWSDAAPRAWPAAMGVGLVMLAIAGFMLVRAQRRVAALIARREALEHLLGTTERP